MLGTGTGSELRQPLGFAIVGGLVVSQLLTLFTTPVIYLYMDRLSGGAWSRPNTLSRKSVCRCGMRLSASQCPLGAHRPEGRLDPHVRSDCAGRLL